MKGYTLRPGIAMIELIFAIVIMGIVMMSAPMLVSTSVNSGFVALQQEAIALAASDMGMITTHHWDEADTNISRPATILTTNGDAAAGLGSISIGGLDTGRRAGTPSSPDARSFYSTLSSVTFASTALGNLGPDAGDAVNDDIDDFIQGATAALNVIGGGADIAIGDIIDQTMTVTRAVIYRNDIPAGGTYRNGGGGTLTLNNPISTATAVVGDTSNIKSIWVNVSSAPGADAALTKNITLNAFSCNIGVYKLNTGNF